MVPISMFFSRLENEIDEIFMQSDGKLEWERAGMNYFVRLCQGDFRTNCDGPSEPRIEIKPFAQEDEPLNMPEDESKEEEDFF